MNKEVSIEESRNAKSREDLIRASKVRTDLGDLSTEAPRQIEFWVSIVGHWPSITNGGPRYILQVRQHFIHQVKVILAQKISWKDNETMKPLDEDNMFYILFGIAQDGISRTNLNLLMSTTSFGLQKRENLQNRVLEFDSATTVNYKDIVKLSKDRRLPQRGAIIEWGRLNPLRIPAFILQMKKNQRFRGWFKCYYDTLRYMFERLTLTGDEAPCIPDLDVEFETLFMNQAKGRFRRAAGEKSSSRVVRGCQEVSEDA